MSEPKRHHYLPQFYLRNFARNGLLSVYDRQRNVYRTQTPINTAVEKDFYTLEDSGGNKNNIIESTISQIESSAQPVIASLDSRNSINEEERVNLSVFIGLLIARTPEFEETFRSIQDSFTRHISKMAFHSVDQTSRMLTKYQNEHPETDPVNPQELYEFVQQDRYDITFPRACTLEMMLHLGDSLWKYFAQMDWLILHAPTNSSFITSDVPFVMVPPRPRDDTFLSNLVGIAVRGVRKLIPLTNQSLLIIQDRGNRLDHKDIDRQATRTFNAILALGSFHYLIAGSEDHLRHIVGLTHLDKKTWVPRMRMGL